MINQKQRFAVLVCALGYFVDVYDIILFTAVRVPSLRSLGLLPAEITHVGLSLMNIQLFGMFLGGIIWGIIGDKRGRLSILFGSIFLYSSTTLANAFISDVQTYGILRFLAGFGLAGELGAGITLVSEILPKEKRGYGTMYITLAGALGGMAGGLVSHFFTWQTAYIMGGLGGFMLLFLRFSMRESTLFNNLQKQAHIKKGSLMQLVSSPLLFAKYIKCLLIGLPFWIFIGLFMAMAPELSNVLHIDGGVTAGAAISLFCLGLALGHVGSGNLSQWIRSRKKATLYCLWLSLGSVICFLCCNTMTQLQFYFFCIVLGLGSGFWSLFILIASEQFGTNMRATVTTSLPNMARAFVIPFAIILSYLKSQVGILWGLGIVIFISIFLALVATFSLKETFDKSLDFVE